MPANRVRQSFDRAAGGYDAHAGLQRQVLERLADRVAPSVYPYPEPVGGRDAPAGSAVLDAGCGTGYLLHAAAVRGLAWRITPLDFAAGMCRQTAALGAPAVQGRLEQLPFASHSFDLVFSSLAMQWLPEPADFLREAARVLRPGGVLAAATFVDGTLEELRTAFAAVDGYSHTLAFHSVPGLLERLDAAGLTLLDTQEETRAEAFADLRSLCARLRGLGASGKAGNTRRSVMTPRQFARAEAAYRAHYGGMTASWRIAYVTART